MNNSVMFKSSTFNDIDDFSSSIINGNIECKQLESGKYMSSISLTGNDKVLITHLKSNRTILQEGQNIVGYTSFLLLSDMLQDFYWRQQRLTGNQFGILKGGMEHSCVSPPNFNGIVVSVRNDHLIFLAQSIGYPRFYESIHNKEVALVNIESATTIQKHLNVIFRNEIIDTNIIEFKIPSMIIHAIAKSSGLFFEENASQHSQYFKKALDFINENIYDKISIPKLSQEIGVSERNLRYIFNGQAGMSPKRFIHNLKLNWIRKGLKHDLSGKGINDISSQMGFWHSGQFAADYKKLFGELPSSTLKFVNT